MFGMLFFVWLRVGWRYTESGNFNEVWNICFCIVDSERIGFLISNCPSSVDCGVSVRFRILRCGGFFFNCDIRVLLRVLLVNFGLVSFRMWRSSFFIRCLIGSRGSLLIGCGFCMFLLICVRVWSRFLYGGRRCFRGIPGGCSWLLRCFRQRARFLFGVFFPLFGLCQRVGVFSNFCVIDKTYEGYELFSYSSGVGRLVVVCQLTYVW